MIGIVLWSDPQDRRAVFWCEDQGDLAYYEGQDAHALTPELFQAGDMVQFSVRADQTMRLAQNPMLLHESACAELPDTLRTAAQHPETAQTPSARIIPFRHRTGSARSVPTARKA